MLANLDIEGGGPYAFNMEDAQRLFVEASAGICILYSGITRGGTAGYGEERSVERLAELVAAFKAIRFPVGAERW